MKIKINSKGFGHIEAILVIAVIAAIGVVGIYVGTHSDKTHAQSSQISTVYTWGRGANDSFISSTPVAVSGLPSDVTDIQAANWGGLAIDSTGTAWQWDSGTSPTASVVSGPTNVVSVGEGFDFGAAVTSSGSLWTWGDEHGQGDLCLSSTNQNNVSPTQVQGVSDATEVSGGADHLVFLENSGHVEACGSNAYGELGDGSYTSSPIPVKVKNLKNIVAVSTGANFEMALDSSGNVWTWGENNYGELGDNSTVNSNVPVEVSLPGPVKEIFAGGSGSNNGQAIVLLDNGSDYAWGNDAWGQLGNDKTKTYSSKPVLVDVPSGVTFTAVATGAQTSYGLDSQGNVWAWGDDSQSQLGDGNSSGYVLQPEKVASGYSQISSVANVVVGG